LKPSTDSASLIDEIEKKISFWVWSSLWGASETGVFFPFWRNLPDSGRQPNELIFWLKVFLESRQSIESSEPLNGFLAYLEPKLWLKNPVFDKN